MTLNTAEKSQNQAMLRGGAIGLTCALVVGCIFFNQLWVEGFFLALLIGLVIGTGLGFAKALFKQLDHSKQP